MARIFKHDGCYICNRCLRRDDIMRSRRENNIWRHIVMIEAPMEAFNFRSIFNFGHTLVWRRSVDQSTARTHTARTHTLLWRRSIAIEHEDTIRWWLVRLIKSKRQSDVEQRWKFTNNKVKREMFTRSTSQERSEPRLYPSWKQTQHGGMRGSWTNTDKRCRLHWRL